MLNNSIQPKLYQDLIPLFILSHSSSKSCANLLLNASSHYCCPVPCRLSPVTCWQGTLLHFLLNNCVSKSVLSYLASLQEHPYLLLQVSAHAYFLQVVEHNSCVMFFFLQYRFDNIVLMSRSTTSNSVNFYFCLINLPSILSFLVSIKKNPP